MYNKIKNKLHKYYQELHIALDDFEVRFLQ